MEWISVKDELPEKDGLYIIYSPFFNIQTRMYYKHHGDRFFGNMKATHWMPLPEPPKE